MFVIFKILDFKRPHMRSDTSHQIVPAFLDLERLVSKKARKPETPSTPDTTLSALDSSSINPLFEDISEMLPSLEQDSPFTPLYFQEPKVEEHSFESVSFTFTQAQQTPVAAPPFHCPSTHSHISFTSTFVHFHSMFIDFI